MTKRKVVIISGSYEPEHCGVSHYVQRLRQELSDEFDTTMLTTVQAARTTKDTSVKGVVSDWKLQNLFSLLRALQKEQFDILHIHHSAASYHFHRAFLLFPALLQAAGFSKPIVTTLHEYGNWEYHVPFGLDRFLSRIKRLGERKNIWDREDGFLLSKSNALVVTNETTENIVLERLPHMRAKLSVVHLAPSVRKYTLSKQQARKIVTDTFDIPSNASILAYFGFLHPVKGLETLLQALQHVLRERQNTYLMLIGGEESLALAGDKAVAYRKKLEQLARKLKIDDRLVITGFVPDAVTSAYLHAADIGVLPLNSGVSVKNTTLLTMMEHQLPIVSTCALPSQEFFARDGILKMVPPRNAEALGNALLSLLQTPQQQADYSHHAFAFSRDYSWEIASRQYTALYNSLLTGTLSRPYQAKGSQRTSLQQKTITGEGGLQDATTQDNPAW